MSELSLVKKGGGKRSATGTVTVPAGTKSFINSCGSTYTSRAGTVSGNSIADCGGMFWKLAADAAVTDDGFVLPVNADVGQTITYYALE